MVVCGLVTNLLDEAEQDLIAPFHLHFIIAYLRQAKDYALDQEVFLLLRFTVGFQRILEYEVSEIAIDDLMEYGRVTEFLHNFRLHFLRSLVDADLNKLGGELILGKLNVMALDAGVDHGGRRIIKKVVDVGNRKVGRWSVGGV